MPLLKLEILFAGVKEENNFTYMWISITNLILIKFLVFVYSLELSLLY